jgi:hypothetical protein
MIMGRWPVAAGRRAEQAVVAAPIIQSTGHAIVFLHGASSHAAQQQTNSVRGAHQPPAPPDMAIGELAIALASQASTAAWTRSTLRTSRVRLVPVQWA